MITAIKIFVLAVLFVVSSGAVFREYFKHHRLLQILAGVVALISAYYLWISIERDLFPPDVEGARVERLEDGLQEPPTGRKTEKGRTDVPSLTYHGYGEVRFGYGLAETERTIGEKVFSRKGWKGGNDDCFHAEFSRYPGVMFMVVGGIVTRADAEAGVKNILNVRVGDSLESVKRKYPFAKIELHKYDPEGHYVIIKSRRPGYAIVLEESQGSITSVRAGMEPSVHWVEHCL